MDYFTADTHLDHSNVIRYCNRPFDDAEEMNAAIIANINAVVMPQDNLWHLGDFSWGARKGDKTNNALHFLRQINCRHVFLIMGNHDPHDSGGHALPAFARLFERCYDLHRLIVRIAGERQEIVLSHYAMKVWNKSHYGAWHLWAHSHGTLPDEISSLSLDVGVDSHNFRPLNLEQIAAIMRTKTFVPVDHHIGKAIDEGT